MTQTTTLPRVAGCPSWCTNRHATLTEHRSDYEWSPIYGADWVLAGAIAAFPVLGLAALVEDGQAGIDVTLTVPTSDGFGSDTFEHIPIVEAAAILPPDTAQRLADLLDLDTEIGRDVERVFRGLSNERATVSADGAGNVYLTITDERRSATTMLFDSDRRDIARFLREYAGKASRGLTP
jgi:hypothetical protein